MKENRFSEFQLIKDFEGIANACKEKGVSIVSVFELMRKGFEIEKQQAKTTIKQIIKATDFEKWELVKPIDNNEMYEFWYRLVNSKDKYSNYKPDRKLPKLFSEEINKLNYPSSSNQEIEPLTRDNLKKHGFDDEAIHRLLNWDNYECKLINSDGYFFASNIEKLIYSGSEGYFKDNPLFHIPTHNSNLLPEYFKRKEAAFLQRQKELLGVLYIEKDLQSKFLNNEIINTQYVIDYRAKIYKSTGTSGKSIEVLNGYLGWLKKIEQNSASTFKSNDTKPPEPIDPLSFVDNALLQTFLNAEKSATNDTLQFDTLARCAAFCAIVYKCGLMTTKMPRELDRKTVCTFAKSRYQMILKPVHFDSAKFMPYIYNKKNDKQKLIECFSEHVQEKIKKLFPKPTF